MNLKWTQKDPKMDQKYTEKWIVKYSPHFIDFLFKIQIIFFYFFLKQIFERGLERVFELCDP